MLSVVYAGVLACCLGSKYSKLLLSDINIIDIENKLLGDVLTEKINSAIINVVGTIIIMIALLIMLKQMSAVFDGHMEKDIHELEGEIIGSGTQDINEEAAENILPLKCTSCGAEVVIDTTEATQARCHWCRNTLSINQQIPNGSIPDVVLPFNVKKEEAKNEIIFANEGLHFIFENNIEHLAN